MSKKSPQLRFEGFTDDWEERKSKDIFKPKIRKGEPDLPVLSVTQTSGVVYRDEVGIDIKYDISTLKNYKVIEPNDFVISLRSFQGGFELSDKLGITSPAYTIFVPKSPEEQNNLFWRIQFKRFQFIQSLKTVTFGIRDGKSISFNEFGDLKIKFPSNILEQQKIGAFFKKLDDTIALHQRKLDLLKEQKKGYLQKMFPKNGAKVPEFRFAGFADDWEQRKLIEVADYRNGKAHEKDISENGDYIVVNSKFVSTNGAVKKFSDELIAPLKKGELAFVLSDVPNGRAIARTFLIDEDNKYSLNQRIAGINPHSDTNSYFLHSLMNRHHYFLRFDDGAGQTNLSKKEVENWTELYPSIEEQDKIGSFFKQLDDTITLHQRKLDLLKEQKKGFLQKMFV
ncbi:restriction endonuclease subunit S [Streptococcus agalactiae]|uniref:restriction endonuclease subunit S n=1 Tax=Streptococcus agalactiae TaxID=1311 RepID=UPI002264AC00|nr:restriction endonuclease subunit S [Streptococcus agalactiae]